MSDLRGNQVVFVRIQVTKFCDGLIFVEYQSEVHRSFNAAKGPGPNFFGWSQRAKGLDSSQIIVNAYSSNFLQSLMQLCPDSL